MWYQRAINHGSPTAANNLGIMYQYGDGIEKDLHKAEELYELSSRRKDPNAMLNLAELLLDKNDFKMSQIWHDRACDAGNIQAQSNRHHFQLRLNIQKQYLRYHPSNSVQMMNKYKNFYSSDVVKPIQKHSHDSRAYNLDELNEYAERGSITAKIMYNALKHFTQASDILKQSEILTKEQERRFVHELAQCYRTEYNVAQVSTVEIREKADKIVDRLLEDCTTKTDAIPSQLDEDVRTCYATLHRESEELIVQFLEPCKQKYPKSIYFFQLSATLNSLLSHYEVALYDINAGLEIDPKSYILLYQKAVILNFFNLEPNELIEAHQAFLAIAPKDHPHVPTMYYSMTIYYLLNYKDNVQMDMIKTIYELGQESEKIQLPYFLPYKSSVRDILKNTFGISTPRNDEKFPLDNRKKRLTNQHRIEIIKKHREWIVPILDTTNNSDLCHISTTVKPRVKQYTAKSLIGLKAISIREMNPTKDHVYSGYVLTVTIIGEPYSWTPSIHLVVEDENLDSERMFIYGFSESQGKHLINEVFTIGSKMSIINPYLRLGAFDHQPLIRVDDFASIITHSESERIINMCRCCGQANAPHVCAICTKARYCSKDCQIMDWKLYEHKLICRKQ
jgi:TPR repeat protein